MKVAHLFIQFPNAYQPYNTVLVTRQQQHGIQVRGFSFVDTRTPGVQSLVGEQWYRRIFYLLRGLLKLKHVRAYNRVQPRFFLAACKHYGRFSLITDWQPDVIHVHHLQVLSTDLTAFLEYSKIPWLISLRGFETGIRPLLSEKEFAFVADRLNRCTAIHAVANDLKKRVMGFGVNPDKIFVIQRTVEVSAPINRVASYVDATGFEIVTIGRFNWKKGFVFLLQAIKILVDKGLNVHLHVAGSGSQDEQAELYYWRWLLTLSNRVTFHGYLNSAQLDNLLAKAHVYVQPSINEGIPNTLLRALINKIPVVASAVDGIPEVVTSEVNGLLVPPGDPMVLATAIERCVNDMDLRDRIHNADQPNISTDPFEEITQYLDMYSSFLGGQH